MSSKNSFKTLLHTVQRVLDEYLGHHQLQTDDHDVQQVELVDHFQSQRLVAEQLHAHVHHAITQRVRVTGHLQHGRDPAVVHDKGARQLLLVLQVGQHVQQEADDVLWELELERPEDELFQECRVFQVLGQSRQVPVIVRRVNVREGFQHLPVFLLAVL